MTLQEHYPYAYTPCPQKTKLKRMPVADVLFYTEVVNELLTKN
jgi:hypothetical protein